MDGKTWCESCDELHTLDKELQVERIFKCVGPIWGQHEAAEKVNKYMIENNMHGKKMTFFRCMEIRRWYFICRILATYGQPLSLIN